MKKKEKKNKKVHYQLDKFHKFWGIWNIIESILLIASGVMCIIFAVMSGELDNKDLPNIVAFLVGGFIIADGTLRIITSLFKPKEQNDEDQSVMLIGGFEMTLGICLMIFYHIFTEFIVKFIAVFIIVIGALFILFSIFAIARRKAKPFVPIMEILFGAILTGVGIGIMVLFSKDDPETSNKIGLICTGSVLLVAGLAQLVITIVILNKKKKEIIKEDTHLNVGYNEAVEELPTSHKQIKNHPEVIEVNSEE